MRYGAVVCLCTMYMYCTNTVPFQPDITFFGEDLPDVFGRRLLDHDRERADLVIVIGTSLKVAPVAEVPGILPRDIPQLYISRTVSVAP